jgi:uncharacterized low-complexity protein
MFVLFFSGCTNQNKESKESVSGMKCGAGKCGANMFDGNKALAKKRKNILNQMREDDPRKDCVLNAPNTKALYNCVRNPMTGRLSIKCGSSTEANNGSGMKCGEGKCGASMGAPSPKPKKQSSMKCDGTMQM